MKILLFDFQARDQDALGGSLMHGQHEVYVETNVAPAGARIDEADIRVVIADGRLPKFGWRELVHQVRADPNKAYVYFILLADPKADDSHEEWAVEAGVDDFLAHLGDERELVRRLRVASRIVDAVLRLW